jgi:hypothetical protein
VSLTQICREGLRFYKRNPLLASGGGLIVAIGLSTSALSWDVLRALSDPKVQGLRTRGYATIAEESPGAPLHPISWRTWKQLEAVLPGIGLCAYSSVASGTLETPRANVDIRLASASASLFKQFAEPLSAGTGFTHSEEESLSGSNPIVLSFRRAQMLFGSPAAAIGVYVRMNGVTFQITGVASQHFEGVFGNTVDAWVPPRFALISLTSMGASAGDSWKGASAFYGIASINNAMDGRAVAAVVRPRLLEINHPKLGVIAGLNTDPVRMAVLRAWAGLAVLLSVLLVAASGLGFGGLLLARAPCQLNEVRLKQSLGAGPTRICLDLLPGPIVVVASGFLGAFLIAVFSMEILGNKGSSGFSLPALWDVSLTIGAEIPFVSAAVVLLAMVPALRLLRDSGIPKTAYFNSGGTRHSTRMLEAIVSVQIACGMLACGFAAMVAFSALALDKRDLGYQAKNRMVLALETTKAGGFLYTTDYRGNTALQTAFGRIIRGLSQVPGVSGVAVAQVAPLDPSPNSITLSEPSDVTNEERGVSYNGVSTEYFKVLGTPLVEGRELSTGIMAGDPREAVVNETLRKQLWHNASAVGKVLNLRHPFGASFTVVVTGVAADQRMAGPKESVVPTVFLPLAGNVFQNLPERLIVSGHISAEALGAAANKELSSALAGIAVARVYLIEDRLRGLLVDEQLRVLLTLGGCAGIAIMSGIGVYSSLVYFITSRRQELAIRMCCGATHGTIFRMVINRAARSGTFAVLIAIGGWIPLHLVVARGWIGQVVWSPLMAGLAISFCLAAILCLAIAPALQASRILPIEGLRGR